MGFLFKHLPGGTFNDGNANSAGSISLPPGDYIIDCKAAVSDTGTGFDCRLVAASTVILDASTNLVSSDNKMFVSLKGFGSFSTQTTVSAIFQRVGGGSQTMIVSNAGISAVSPGSISDLST